MAEHPRLQRRAGRTTERRRFPRYAWTTAVQLKTLDDRDLEGTFLDVSESGGKLEIMEDLSSEELLTIRIGPDMGFYPEAVELPGKTVWKRHGCEGPNRYGVVFMGGHEKTYEGLERFREFVHTRATAETMGLMFVELTPSMVETPALSCLNRDLAFSLNCMPIKLRGERLMVAMASPDNQIMVKKLQVLCSCQIFPVAATPSAIRGTQIHYWEGGDVPSDTERSEAPSDGRHHQSGKPSTVALVSSTPRLGTRCLAASLAAALNSDEERALIADLDSSGLASDGSVATTSAENYDLVLLPLPLRAAPPSLEWTVRADETVLVTSPSHWEEGCRYIEATFDWFVRSRRSRGSSSLDAPIQQRVLRFSVACVSISDPRQGFLTFSKMEKTVHHKLDMRHPTLDVRLSYVGGIVDDKRNDQWTHQVGPRISKLHPQSRVSPYVTHIAQSLLKPPPERDPRVPLRRTRFQKLHGAVTPWTNPFGTASRNWMLPAVAFAFLAVFLMFQLGKDLGSGTFMASSISPRRDTHVEQRSASDTHKEGSGPQRPLEELEPSQPSSIDEVESRDPFQRPTEVLVKSPGEENSDVVIDDQPPEGDPTLIRRSRIALAVENREPIGVQDRVSVQQGRVYCWMHVLNGKGRKLTVRWIAKGREFWETHLAVGSDNWRTWAYVTLRPSLVGPARVDIVDDDGELLYTESFEITG